MKVPQRSVKIKFNLIFFLRPGLGRERLVYLKKSFEEVLEPLMKFA